MAVSGTGGGGGKSIEAGKAHVSFSAKDAGLEGYLDRTAARVGKFGKTVAGIGGGMMGIGAAVLAPLAALFTEAVKHFDDVNDAADRLGTTTEAISRLGYAADLAGSSMDEVEAAARIMQKQLFKAPKAFEAIGLSAEELKGMDLEEQFLAIAGAVSELDDVSRGPALQGIFGRGGNKLAPMLKDGAAALKDALDEADRVGDTVDSLDASRAAKTADAFDKSWKSVKNTLRAVGAAFLPLADAIDGAIGPFLAATAGVRAFIGANRAGVQAVAAWAAALVVVGGAVVGLGGMIQVLGFALSGLALLFSPFAIIAVTVGAATAALLLFSQTATGTGGVVGMLGAIGETLKETFGGITDALETGDFEAAWAIMLAGLELAWTQFVNGIWHSLQTLWANIAKGWKETAANAALAQGKTPDEAAWYDGLATLWDEFNREVLGGPDKAASGAFVKEGGKTVLSEEDKKRAAAVDEHNKALAKLEEEYAEAIKRADEFGQARVQRLKDELTAKRAGAAAGAADARWWKELLADASYGAWGAEAADAMAESVGTGGTFRGTFTGESAQAASSLKEIADNTKKSNELLDDIRDEVGGVLVD